MVFNENEEPTLTDVPGTSAEWEISTPASAPSTETPKITELTPQIEPEAEV